MLRGLRFKANKNKENKENNTNCIYMGIENVGWCT